VGRPTRRQLALCLGTWGLLQLALVTGPTWLRARGFGFSNYDFGIYSQAVARLALDPPNPWLSGRQIHVFNDHFDPVLFLVAPFARAFPAAAVGLVAEGLFALLALLPLAWLAREGRLTLRALWLWCGLLTLSPGVTQALGFPFHPTTWAMAPMAWLLAALALERWSVSLVALVALLACKEEFPFVGLALSPSLFVRAPRRHAWAFLGVSVAWGVFALVVRPRLLGDVMPYASQPFRGLEEGLGAFLATRLSGKALAGMGDLVVAFAPAVAWAVLDKVGQNGRREGLLLLALLPLLGIRFLSVAWRDHYGAVVISAAVIPLAVLLGDRRPPVWVLITTLLLLGAGNELLLRRDWRALMNQQGWAASVGCVDKPGRAAAVRAAVETVRALPGPLFVSGNLLPWLAERDDVYAFGGPQPASLTPRAVLIEAPPCGDTWDQPPEVREALYAAWKARRDVTTLSDDAFVFAAVVGAAP
jgi:hypothetical protein